jgi:hypothetical protein
MESEIELLNIPKN